MLKTLTTSKPLDSNSEAAPSTSPNDVDFSVKTHGAVRNRDSTLQVLSPSSRPSQTVPVAAAKQAVTQSLGLWDRSTSRPKDNEPIKAVCSPFPLSE
ncbi:hypothetical protein KY285_019538 [Solanum tuberosum]|nr:hypothetical protein KY285_019538 [Solanum tuberosum]